jgi:hypothetical protein
MIMIELLDAMKPNLLSAFCVQGLSDSMPPIVMIRHQGKGAKPTFSLAKDVDQKSRIPNGVVFPQLHHSS